MIGVLLIPKRLSHRRPPVTHSKTVDSTIHASTPWIRLLRGLSGEPGWDKISSNLGSQKSIFGVPILSHLYENPQINTTQREKKPGWKMHPAASGNFPSCEFGVSARPARGPTAPTEPLGWRQWPPVVSPGRRYRWRTCHGRKWTKIPLWSPVTWPFEEGKSCTTDFKDLWSIKFRAFLFYIFRQTLCCRGPKDWWWNDDDGHDKSRITHWKMNRCTSSE